MKTFLLVFMALALVASAALSHHPPPPPYHSLRTRLRRQTADQNAHHTWAVLVAGSSSWSNYRHQADICHTYQLLHRAGVPDEHIIVFMYDDIADNVQNPFKGKIFNDIVTGTSADVDVYPGVPKDYNGKDATADNLLAVLTGETPVGGSGKTLKSTAEDNVFFFYDDHGNVGLVAMPYGRRFLDSDMTKAFNVMSEKKMFKNFIILMQACESGSMFYKQNLPDNVYVSTSAPVYQSAYACHYDQKLRTYIASCWPYGWLKEVEAKGADTTFDHVLNYAYYYALNNSQTRPCQYGDVDLKRFTLREFFAPDDNVADVHMQHKHHHEHHHHLHHHHGRMARHAPAPANIIVDETACPQYDVPYQVAKRNYEYSKSPEDYVELQRQIEIRKKIENVLYKIMEAALPAENNAKSGFLKTPVCEKCDDSCGCMTQCAAAGYTEEECKRHCCGYSGCTGTAPPYPDYTTCVADFTEKFETACGYINNDYMYVASKFLGRLCRFPGANVQAALAAIPSVCKAY